MRVEVCTDSAAAASRAAELLVGHIERAIVAREVAAVALSGGRTPAGMLRELAAASIDWQRVHVFQVDERLVAEDDERRNVRTIRVAFAQSGIPARQLHAMPVGRAAPEAAAAAYAHELRAVAGTPAALDAVHLGLGEDGHTASLFPGDPAIDLGGDIVLSGVHDGMRRMTLTLEVINRARARVWLVTGAAKRESVQRLLERDTSRIAARVRSEDAVLVLDRDASGNRQ
jgi:6-phosphogluconolactonase